MFKSNRVNGPLKSINPPHLWSTTIHIGLIGGIGPAATEFYYRGLVNSQTAETKPLELTIAHADLKTQLRNMSERQPQAQAEVFRDHLKQLAGAGANVAAVTSIAGHFCFAELDAISPLPLVSAEVHIRALAALSRREE